MPLGWALGGTSSQAAWDDWGSFPLGHTQNSQGSQVHRQSPAMLPALLAAQHPAGANRRSPTKPGEDRTALSQALASQSTAGAFLGHRRNHS